MTFAHALGRAANAVWTVVRRRRGTSTAPGLDDLRRRYVFGGITRAELEEGLRKMRRRFKRR